MDTAPDNEASPLQENEPSGAGPMLATLVGVLLSLVALGVILFRLFPSSSSDAAAPETPAVVTTALPATTTLPGASVAEEPSSTAVAPSSTTTVVSSSSASVAGAAEDAAPEINDVEVVAGSTVAAVSFTTATCVNARYDYSGATTGRHEGAGYPDATNCWTEHLARLGEWTEPLVPGSSYVVDVTVIDAEGRTDTTTVEFTTSS